MTFSPIFLRRHKTALTLVALLLLCLIVFFLWKRHSADSENQARYETAEVSRGTVAAKVTATGTLSALVTVQVGSQVSGRIAEILVDYNSSVKKGQVLARLDPELFRAALAQEEANRLTARANLNQAAVQSRLTEREYKRSEDLYKRSLASESERDTALAAHERAKAAEEAAAGALAQAQAALNRAQINLSYATIYSPNDGVVISRSVDVGQTVAASLQAPTLFTIAEDLRRMQVDTAVSESDVGKLNQGMEASFQVDAYPRRTFKGTVRQVRNAPQISQNVVTYDAVIDVENPELLLKPGMTANVTFILGRKDDALLVPNAALRFRMDGVATANDDTNKPERDAAEPAADAPERRRVWVLKDNRPRPVMLTLGLSDGSRTEVLSGELTEGDLVIVDMEQTEKSGFSGPPLGAPRVPGMRRM